jgi:hypothetical protein
VLRRSRELEDELRRERELQQLRQSREKIDELAREREILERAEDLRRS